MTRDVPGYRRQTPESTRGIVEASPLPRQMLDAMRHDRRLSSTGRYARRGAARSLYLQGQLHSSDLPQARLAIIGTRQLSPSMSVLTLRVIQALKLGCGRSMSPSVLSGLALGCDTEAHAHALDEGVHTVAVLPGGPRQITPASNRELARNILREGGALCSERPDGAPIERSSFVLRDHLQAQMSDALICIATSKGGGSLHATRESLMLERPTAIILPPRGEAESAGWAGSEAIATAALRKDGPALCEALGLEPRHAKLAMKHLRIIRNRDDLHSFIAEACGAAKPC